MGRRDQKKINALAIPPPTPIHASLPFSSLSFPPPVHPSVLGLASEPSLLTTLWPSPSLVLRATQPVHERIIHGLEVKHRDEHIPVLTSQDLMSRKLCDTYICRI